MNQTWCINIMSRLFLILVPVPLQISCVIWPLMTSWRSKGATLFKFKHMDWFFPILSYISICLKYLWRKWPFHYFFSLFLYMVTFDDLTKVKQGHSQMGFISSLIYNSMNKNLWKFHASTLLCTIIEQICPSHELWWPPKVKKGHS